MCIICQINNRDSKKEHENGAPFQGTVDAQGLPSWTLDQQANYLTDGYWRDKWQGPRRFNVQAGDTLTVNITGLDAEGQRTARDALATWSVASGLKFAEVTGWAQIHFDDNDANAYSNSSIAGTTLHSSFINVDPSWRRWGTYYFQTYIHEIGHALGLGHAGNYNFTSDFNRDAKYQEDSWRYSIMSYFDQDQNPYDAARKAFVTTPALTDIVAIQKLYGTPTTRSGDDMYGDVRTDSSSGTDILGWFSQTIYDSGGYDTINIASRNGHQMLDLRAEHFSNIDWGIANLALARGTVIEAALLGDGNDKVIGNEAANTINGGGGDDLLYGNGGDDILIGGKGNDLLDGGDGIDRAVFAGRSSDYAVVYDKDTGAALRIRHLRSGAEDKLVGIEKVAFDDLMLDTAKVVTHLEARFGKLSAEGAGRHEMVLSADADKNYFESLPDIDGPFSATARVRFDDLKGGSYQRVFDAGNGPWSNNVHMGQVGSTNDMAFWIFRDGAEYMITAKNSIEQGVEAKWTASVDERGWMRLFKNDVEVAHGPGVVPKDIDRAIELIGKSNWSWDTPLKGTVRDLQIVNHDRSGLPDIDGAFSATINVRFDDPAGGQWQRAFDIGNGAAQDNIYLGQSGNSRDMVFRIYDGDRPYTITARDAIVKGEAAEWTTSVDSHGWMRLYKNGALLAEGQGVVPRDINRKYELIGQSNWSHDTPLIGSATNFKMASVNTIPEISGEFSVFANVRFDNLAGGSFQRIFDTGNGAGKDNIYFGQEGNGDDMLFTVMQGTRSYQVRATDVIKQGEEAHWGAKVDANGMMQIYKNGVMLAQGQGVVADDVIRSMDHIGSSNWSWDTPLIGAVNDLFIYA